MNLYNFISVLDKVTAPAAPATATTATMSSVDDHAYTAALENGFRSIASDSSPNPFFFPCFKGYVRTCLWKDAAKILWAASDKSLSHEEVEILLRDIMTTDRSAASWHSQNHDEHSVHSLVVRLLQLTKGKADWIGLLWQAPPVNLDLLLWVMLCKPDSSMMCLWLGSDLDGFFEAFNATILADFVVKYLPEILKEHFPHDLEKVLPHCNARVLQESQMWEWLIEFSMKNGVDIARVLPHFVPETSEEHFKALNPMASVDDHVYTLAEGNGFTSICPEGFPNPFFTQLQGLLETSKWEAAAEILWSKISEMSISLQEVENLIEILIATNLTGDEPGVHSLVGRLLQLTNGKANWDELIFISGTSRKACNLLLWVMLCKRCNSMLRLWHGSDLESFFQAFNAAILADFVVKNLPEILKAGYHVELEQVLPHCHVGVLQGSQRWGWLIRFSMENRKDIARILPHFVPETSEEHFKALNYLLECISDARMTEKPLPPQTGQTVWSLLKDDYLDLMKAPVYEEGKTVPLAILLRRLDLGFSPLDEALSLHLVFLDAAEPTEQLLKYVPIQELLVTFCSGSHESSYGHTLTGEQREAVQDYLGCLGMMSDDKRQSHWLYLLSEGYFIAIILWMFHDGVTANAVEEMDSGLSEFHFELSVNSFLRKSSRLAQDRKRQRTRPVDRLFEAEANEEVTMEHFKMLSDALNRAQGNLFKGVKDWIEIILGLGLPFQVKQALLALLEGYCLLDPWQLVEVLSHLVLDLDESILHLPLLAFVLGDPRVTWKKLKRKDRYGRSYLTSLQSGDLMWSKEVLEVVREVAAQAEDTKFQVYMAKGLHTNLECEDV
ncbi:MAG: hypothetical protein ACPGJP_03015 [Hyphomicrobiales bacterium]